MAEAAHPRSINYNTRKEGVPSLFLLPHISGQRSHIAIVDELIRCMRAAGYVWFATHEQVARYCKQLG